MCNLGNRYNKYGIVHFIFQNDVFLSLKIAFTLANSSDPDIIPLGGISSGSSLFAKVPVCSLLQLLVTL